MAVIAVPCNSDFGTNNKMVSSDFWARNGLHAVSSGSKKIIGKAPVGRTHQECWRVILVPSS